MLQGKIISSRLNNMENATVRIITEPVSIAQLQEIANERFGDMVKAVVDVEKKIMAAGAEMHADEEQVLLDMGSKQPDLWGINLYPALYGQNDFLEFDSMINLRPNQGNRSRSVEDEGIRVRIEAIVKDLIR